MVPLYRRTGVLHKSSVVTNRTDAIYHYMVAQPDASLEFGLDYPDEVTFLKDTTPATGQWKRTKNYYGQSLYGADVPDRWIIGWK